MEWSEGDNWYLEVDLFPGVTDFKCAVVRQDGSVASWEPGANRTVEANTPAMHSKTLAMPPTCCVLHFAILCAACFSQKLSQVYMLFPRNFLYVVTATGPGCMLICSVVV